MAETSRALGGSPPVGVWFRAIQAMPAARSASQVNPLSIVAARGVRPRPLFRAETRTALAEGAVSGGAVMLPQPARPASTWSTGTASRVLGPARRPGKTVPEWGSAGIASLAASVTSLFARRRDAL